MNRLAGPARRGARLGRMLFGLTLLALFPLAWLMHAEVIDPDAPTLCAFRAMTGEPCPFCGLTRAFASAMHGQFADALDYHTLWWLFAAIVLALGLLSLFDAAFDRRATSGVGRFVQNRPRLLVGCIIAVWVARLLV